MATKAAPKAEVFSLKVPYLSQGRHDTTLARDGKPVAPGKGLRRGR